MEVCMVYNLVCRKGQTRQTCAESGSTRKGTVQRVVSREVLWRGMRGSLNMTV